MARSGNAYDKMKNKGKKGSLNFSSALKQEETYWAGAGAAVVLMPFISIIDGGFGLAVAYGAKKLYDYNNNKK